jgi:hypothetical protein
MVNNTNENAILSDPAHERYRKCPECGLEFHTDHLLRRFCGVKCHDRFHARRKRQAKASITSQVNPDNPILRNRMLLQALCGDEAECELSMQELLSLGFDFRTIEHRVAIDNHPNSFYLEIGDFRLYCRRAGWVNIVRS